jgi:hypothetical protein
MTPAKLRSPQNRVLKKSVPKQALKLICVAASWRVAGVGGVYVRPL